MALFYNTGIDSKISHALFYILQTNTYLLFIFLANNQKQEHCEQYS
jgi:hypothetical protein